NEPVLAPVDVETEAPAVAPVTEESGNQFTNDAPAAVIMGAADASEEHSDVPTAADEPAVEDKAPENSDVPAVTDEPAIEDKVPENPEEME
ncbi:MAG: hypothetical protein DRP64_17115, partial [Verrucomicrobia bacterium]